MEVLRSENKRLRDELDEATRDFVDLKNQAVTVTWLKDKLAEYENKVGARRIIDRSATWPRSHKRAGFASCAQSAHRSYRWTSW